MLVEHGIWVANNHGLSFFIRFLVSTILQSLSCDWEEHSINLCLRIIFIVGDPSMLTLKILPKDIAHLCSVSEKGGEAVAALAASAAAVARSDGLLGNFDVGFGSCEQFPVDLHVFFAVYYLWQASKHFDATRERTASLQAHAIIGTFVIRLFSRTQVQLIPSISIFFLSTNEMLK